MPVHVLGIRHHGPGSARSVRAALDELRPDVVVIEGAPELEQISAHAADPALVPPVAALVYDLQSPSRATFYPLAVFSPEWVALRWAHDHDRPVRFADLPAVHALASTEPDASESAPEDDAADPQVDATNAESHPVRSDPIALLAEVAGYADPERWWEDSIEHRTDSVTSRFAHVAEAMRVVREQRPELDDELNQRREAAMRRVLREVIAAHDVVAVVCGAFHAPALDPASWPSRAADNRLLSGLPRTKVGTTWAPWTHGRLSVASGYGAGVTAPGWYHHLFTAGATDEAEVSTSWLVRVGRALRGHELDSSPASAVEAARLASALAAVRGRPSAGLEELDDAALAVLCEGSPERLGLVRRELWVGEELGSVPEDTPMVPLASDLAKQQKSLRLKPSASTTSVQLDLRQPAQLARSTLFHRLTLLAIPWAVPADSGRTTGTFKEAWSLTWEPELAVRLVEASLYGTTIESACSARVGEAAATADLPGLSALVEACLLADLPQGLEAVVDRLGARTAHSHDIRELLGTVEPLARTIRYGDVRGQDTARLHDLVRVVVGRVCVGLRAGCQSLDEDLATTTRTALEAAHRGILLLDDPELAEPWWAALGGLGPEVHGALAGRVDRLLHDAGTIPEAETAARMGRRLSVAEPAPDGAAWLEAFLGGEAILLLHDPALLRLVDEWVSGISEETFEDLLPLVRRTFSRFAAPERRQLADRVAHGTSTPSDSAPLADLDRALPAIRTTARLLGLELSA